MIRKAIKVEENDEDIQDYKPLVPRLSDSSIGYPRHGFVGDVDMSDYFLNLMDKKQKMIDSYEFISNWSIYSFERLKLKYRDEETALSGRFIERHQTVYQFKREAITEMLKEMKEEIEQGTLFNDVI